MERKEAIRGAYRMTGGKRRLSGKGNVRYSGAFLRQAAGSAGGNRDSDHAGLSDYAGGRHHLPRYEDDTFDIVLSLNGFHAFPDKEAAYREVFRVVRPGGTFCGCFYVMGEHKRTDWFVRHVYEKAGFFTPPYETAFSLKKRLGKLYEAVTLGTVKSMVWFVCRKGLR